MIFSSAHRGISFPSYFSTIRGFTFSPLISGLVSMWAIKPTTGTSWSTFEGSVANKYPFSSKEISFNPSSSSSVFRYCANTICFGVLGVTPVDSSDCVSKVTYFKKRSITVISLYCLQISYFCKSKKYPENDQKTYHFLSERKDDLPTYGENSDTSLPFKLKRQGNPKTLKISPIRFDSFL